MRIEPIDLVGINGVVSRTWVPNLRRKIRSTSENENSGVSFQKMLEKELSKYDSDDVLITNLNEEYSASREQTSFEKKYCENSKMETIYWKNVLTRMLDRNFASELEKLCNGGGNRSCYNLDSINSSICGSNSAFKSFFV